MKRLRFISPTAFLLTALLALSATLPAQASDGANSGDDRASKERESKNNTSLNETVPAALVNLPPASRYYSPYAFVVDKAARTLTVWQQTGQGLKKIADFPADMGKNAGEKRVKNDAKTPEGIYFLTTQLEGPSLDFSQYGKRAFTTDYPNFFDRLEEKTGYGIWLHAIPDKVPLTRGSRGCVVVRNDVILDLTQYVRLGRTPLLIQGKTELMPTQDLAKETATLLSWIESWRAAWEAKNIDGYIAAYSKDFQSMKMGREEWKTYKSGLNEKYQKISVRLSKPAVFVDRKRAVVRFLQEYTSDQHSDFGEKVLYLAKEKTETGEAYRIIGETWAQETSEIAREEIEATTNATTGSSDLSGNRQSAGIGEN